MASKRKNRLCAWLCFLVVGLSLAEDRAWGIFESPQPESGQIALSSHESIGENAAAWRYDAPGYAVAPKKGLGSNPFKGKTPKQIDKMLRKKGYEPRGPNPMNGKGTYVNPKTGRSIHLDHNHPPPKPPHIGVQRPRGKRDLPVKEYPLE